MAHVIGRFLGKEDSLIDVGGHSSPAEMLAECAASHENDLVEAGIFLIPGAAATDAAGIIAHAYDGSVIERAE
jgi:hypothetical protein